MKFILRYAKPIKYQFLFVFFIKAVAAFLELLIPYVLEYIIDDVVLTDSVPLVLLWGAIMITLAVTVRQANIFANRRAVNNATNVILNIRRDLFDTTMNLSGEVFDEFGLPSLTSRMTTDSYNVQNFVRMFQTMGIRSPMLLIGGISLTLIMDRGLALILCVIVPVMISLVVFISFKGIPLYENVQKKMDGIVRVMRENITGVRVVKALSKEESEKQRFYDTNNEMTKTDMKASIVMSLPGPVMQLFLNGGLTLVVFIGARRVNAGVTEPGVILAFLTYFNMILFGVMGLNRIFMMMSKANASAKRISSAVDARNSLEVIEQGTSGTERDGYIVFDHVSFGYAKAKENEIVAGGERQLAITDIDFSIKKGGSIGIIGATGSGKTTIFNLLMRYYDTGKGAIYIGGRDVRTFEKDELHSRFGTVFQNDVILTGTIRDNIVFGREVTDDQLVNAAKYAGAYEFISKYPDGFDHEVTKLGTNLSGGQKQRILIARALVGNPDILILDDASSALDYKTDSDVRKAIKEHFGDTTQLIVAQRISSLMHCDEILVLEEGRIVARGSHRQLLEQSNEYRSIYETQMGE